MEDEEPNALADALAAACKEVEEQNAAAQGAKDGGAQAVAVVDDSKVEVAVEVETETEVEAASGRDHNAAPQDAGTSGTASVSEAVKEVEVAVAVGGGVEDEDEDESESESDSDLDDGTANGHDDDDDDDDDGDGEIREVFDGASTTHAVSQAPKVSELWLDAQTTAFRLLSPSSVILNDASQLFLSLVITSLLLSTRCEQPVQNAAAAAKERALRARREQEARAKQQEEERLKAQRAAKRKVKAEQSASRKDDFFGIEYKRSRAGGGDSDDDGEDGYTLLSKPAFDDEREFERDLAGGEFADVGAGAGAAVGDEDEDDEFDFSGEVGEVRS